MWLTPAARRASMGFLSGLAPAPSTDHTAGHHRSVSGRVGRCQQPRVPMSRACAHACAGMHRCVHAGCCRMGRESGSREPAQTPGALGHPPRKGPPSSIPRGQCRAGPGPVPQGHSPPRLTPAPPPARAGRVVVLVAPKEHPAPLSFIHKAQTGKVERIYRRNANKNPIRGRVWDCFGFSLPFLFVFFLTYQIE